MKAEEIFKEGEYLWYDDIVSYFGEILHQVDDEDYQGDIRFFLKNGNKYGWYIVGYGSCSGCDWLHGCETMKEKQDLINEIEREIEWFDSLDDIKERFRTKDWELEWYGQQDLNKEFVNYILNYNK